MDASIVPFLPSIQETGSGDLQWPPQLATSLQSLVGGTQVLDSEALCDAINDLREQSHLPMLSTAVLHGIETYFDELITREAAESFFQNVLPFMADLAFRLPVLLNDHLKHSMKVDPPIKRVDLRMLEQQQPGFVYMTQELVATILACAFFCLCPLEGREEAKLPHFNFDGLFARIGNKVALQEQKIHCIVHYFTRVSKDMPQGMISYERKVLPRRQQHEIFSSISEPDESFWSRSTASFCPIQVLQEGMIEDQKLSALEIDFANRYLGGGVLRHGCVQEEIRFVISPELIAGMLFMPAMQANEAIEIRGAERFSCYTGYSSTFCFAGDYVDTKPRDLQGRRETRIVAIDAVRHPGQRQFEKALMLRETNKAFCGFLDHLELFFSRLPSRLTDNKEPPLLKLRDPSQTAYVSNLQSSPSDSCEDQGTLSDTKQTGHTSDVPIDAIKTSSIGCTMGIATGNWGCGAFGGNAELKSLLQWIAASQAGRPHLQYFTFGGSHGPMLQQVADWIINKKWPVGKVWDLLVDYGEKRLRGVHKKGLFEWILPHLSRASIITLSWDATNHRGCTIQEDKGSDTRIEPITK